MSGMNPVTVNQLSKHMYTYVYLQYIILTSTIFQLVSMDSSISADWLYIAVVVQLVGASGTAESVGIRKVQVGKLQHYITLILNITGQCNCSSTASCGNILSHLK